MKVLVPGANGFLGKELVKILSQYGFDVTSAVRNVEVAIPGCSKIVGVGNIQDESLWQPALVNQDVVIHLANRAHVMNDAVTDPLPLYRQVNVEGTITLAKAAIKAGVKRYIFLSSIKVNGEATFEHPFRASDEPHPEDPYAVSKWEAEQQLTALCLGVSMELVIIRPPLIYGPGVKGNLANLERLVSKPIPLPLGSIRNKRDLISLGNLTDLIRVCVDHPNATGQTFLCSDGQALSTPELIRHIARAQGTKPLLVPFPVSILAQLARISRKKSQFERLAGNLRIDMTHTEQALNWTPPNTVANSMQWAFGDRENA